MPFSYGNQNGRLITGSVQTLVSAPISGQQRAVRSLRLTNPKSNSGSVEFQMWYREGASDRVITERTLAAGGACILGPDDLLNLDDITTSIVGKIVSGTKGLDWIASYGDLS